MTDALIEELRKHAELVEAWGKFELGRKPPPPLTHNETMEMLNKAADAITQAVMERDGAQVDVCFHKADAQVWKARAEKAEAALSAPGDAQEYLCEGTRFKLSFNKAGNVSCLANFRHELDGKWVALVDATDGKHLNRRPVEPVVTDEMVEAALNAPIPGGSKASWWFIPPDAKVRENPELHEKARENIRDVAKRMLTAALNVSQPGVK